MTNPCVSRATLRETHELCNEYTIDAIKPTGLDSCLINERDILALLDYTVQLRPFQRNLDPDLTGEVASETILAAVRRSDGPYQTYDLARLKRLAWPIACRRQARELRTRSTYSVLSDLELVVDPSGETPFRLIETECAIEAATNNLIVAGVPADGVSAVVLHFLGWSPSQIAESFGQKVDAVRKRIYRLRGRVRSELQTQFRMEGA